MNRVEDVILDAFEIPLTEISKGAFASTAERVLPGSNRVSVPSFAVKPTKKDTEGLKAAKISGTISEEENPNLKSTREGPSSTGAKIVIVALAGLLVDSALVSVWILCEATKDDSIAGTPMM